MKIHLSWSPYLLSIFALVLLNSCSDDDDNGSTPPDQDKIAGFELFATVEAPSGPEILAYQQDAPTTGYNRLAFKVKSSDGAIMENAQLSLLPMMDMGSMEHSAPVNQPSYSSDEKAWMGAVTYIMPTTSNGNWELRIILRPDAGAEPDTISIPVEVSERDPSELFSFTEDGVTYFVALREPQEPEIGMNPYGYMIYSRSSMMDFPPVSGLSTAIEPWMPDMNHGSPDNVHPFEQQEQGYYLGEANFTMGGLWEVRVDILNANGDTLHTDHFEHDL